MLQAGSKRRRTKKQIEEEKQEEILKRQQIEAKVANFDALQAKVAMLEENQRQGQAAADLVKQFLDAGVVEQDEDGGFAIAGDGNNRRFKPFE